MKSFFITLLTLAASASAFAGSSRGDTHENDAGYFYVGLNDSNKIEAMFEISRFSDKQMSIINICQKNLKENVLLVSTKEVSVEVPTEIAGQATHAHYLDVPSIRHVSLRKNRTRRQSARTRNTSARLLASNEGCVTDYFLPHPMIIGSQISNTKMRSARGFWASLNSRIR